MELWLLQNNLIGACVANSNSWYSLFIQMASLVILTIVLYSSSVKDKDIQDYFLICQIVSVYFTLITSALVDFLESRFPLQIISVIVIC